MDNERPTGSFAAAMQTAMVVAKLYGFVSWSWWWVLAPALVMGAGFLAHFTLAGLVKLFEPKEKDK